MRPLSALCAVATALGCVRPSLAQTPGAASPRPSSSASAVESRGPYVHTFSSFGYGRGIRWNNPYRLQSSLGDGPESASLTAGYFDAALGALLGDPNGWQHGAVLHLSFAANGISQQVLSVSYVGALPLGASALAYARAGVPFVLSPNAGVGFEAAAGAVYFFTGALGVNAELIQSLFVGAATWEHDPTLYPITSLQLGLWFDYEVFP